MPPEKRIFKQMTEGKKVAKIGDLLPGILRRIGLEQRFKEQQILTLWPTVVGEELASRARATKIDRGVLYVQVDHGAWMQELHFIEKELIKKLRDCAPGANIKQIRFSAKDIS